MIKACVKRGKWVSSTPEEQHEFFYFPEYSCKTSTPAELNSSKIGWKTFRSLFLMRNENPFCTKIFKFWMEIARMVKPGVEPFMVGNLNFCWSFVARAAAGRARVFQTIMITILLRFSTNSYK